MLENIIYPSILLYIHYDRIERHSHQIVENIFYKSTFNAFEFDNSSLETMESSLTYKTRHIGKKKNFFSHILYDE